MTQATLSLRFAQDFARKGQWKYAVDWLAQARLEARRDGNRVLAAYCAQAMERCYPVLVQHAS